MDLKGIRLPVIFEFAAICRSSILQKFSYPVGPYMKRFVKLKARICLQDNELRWSFAISTLPQFVSRATNNSNSYTYLILHFIFTEGLICDRTTNGSLASGMSKSSICWKLRYSGTI